MPYIVQRDRNDFDPLVEDLASRLTSPGDLNYVITRLVALWIGKPLSYTAINAAIGVLECAKLEAYRRLAAPYEDEKVICNGDVPEYSDARPWPESLT